MRSLGLVGMATLLLAITNKGVADSDSAKRDVALIEAGEAIYQQNCASCHGLQGEGMPDWERPNAQGELPAPPHDEEGHTWKHSDAMLYRIISEGWRDPWNETERLTMPAFEDMLTPREIRAVVIYLKTLWTPEQRRHQKQESKDEPFPSETNN